MADFPSWQQGLRQEYPSLKGAQRVDAAIVGGGLTGVTTALMLQECGLKTALIEADILGHGATFGCGGMVSCQAHHAYQTIANTVGMDTARVFAQLMREAVWGVSGLIQRLRIPCSYTETSVYTYAETEADLPALERLLALENKLNLTLSVAPDAGGCPFPVELSAVMHHQGMLQPLPYLLGLADAAAKMDCHIYERSPVLQRSGTTLRTADGSIAADAILLCTGVPLECQRLPILALMQPRLREARLLHGTPPMHTVQLSVLADEMTLRPLQQGMLMTFDRGALGTRQADASRIIRDRTLHALLPEAHTKDVILRREVHSRDGLPLIGPIEPQHSAVLMASGFGGWGVTGSFLAARILTGTLLGRPLPESKLFLPFRSYTTRARVIRHGLAASAKAYIRGYAHPSTPRCPHMGCPLRYNPSNRRWECPCHGSVFDVLGQVEAAPASRDAQLSPKDRPYA